MSNLLLNDLNKARFLFFDHGGVLDGSFIEGNPTNKDLVLTKVEGMFQIIKNGVEIVKQLNSLVSLHGYQIIFHSKNKETEQLHMLSLIQKACYRVKLTFPKITAMAVRDTIEFNGVESENPAIIKNKQHGIWIAGYDKELDGKACVRNALSKLLFISETSRKQHFIFDDGPSVVNIANKEGWSTYLIGDQFEAVTLDKAVDSIYQLEIQSKQQNSFAVISTDEFILNNKLTKENSAFTRHFHNSSNKIEYIGKCSQKSIGGTSFENGKLIQLKGDSFNEYNELLALKLYALFGVITPKNVVLSQQKLSKDVMYMYGAPDENEPRLHLMTSYVEGLKVVDDHFLLEYLNFQKLSNNSYYKIRDLPLKGLGRAFAVAKLLLDFDFFNRGRMGYIFDSFSWSYVIVIIDAEDALDFSKSDKYFSILFDELNYLDQQEFELAEKDILKVSDEEISSVFRPVIADYPEFENKLNFLLEWRKSKFSDELIKITK